LPAFLTLSKLCFDQSRSTLSNPGSQCSGPVRESVQYHSQKVLAQIAKTTKKLAMKSAELALRARQASNF